MTFSEDSRQKLKSVSTATLTSVLLKHGLRNVFIRNVHKINKGAPRLVGPAYTLRYIPAREDIDHTGVFVGRGHFRALPAGSRSRAGVSRMET